MTFQLEKHFDFEKNIDQKRPYYAHTSETYDKEPLTIHLERSLECFEKLLEKKHLDKVFQKFEEQFFSEYSNEAAALWRQMVVDVIYGHDLGKINPDFQWQKMDNGAFKEAKLDNCNHSQFSAQIYYLYYYPQIDRIDDDATYQFMCRFLVLHCFVIAKHHSKLSGIGDFIEHFKKWGGSFGERINAFKGESSGADAFDVYDAIMEMGRQLEDAPDFYIYIRFIYDLLVACDFYATSEYHQGKIVDDFGTLNAVEDYIQIFEENAITQSIRRTDRNQAPEGEINILRSQMFLEAEEQLLLNKDKNLFKLNAPTGSGKTHTSINLALKLLEADRNLNRIFYIFPFNTLVEQTNATLKKSLGEALAEKIGVINSVTAIKLEDSGSEQEDGEWQYDQQQKRRYEKALLSRQFLHYPIVLTTHVQFFNILFGQTREDIFPLVHLANSVVILDEIQSYRNDIWDKIIFMLKKYAALLNIRIIIMSATLPDLDQLAKESEPGCELILNKEKYFKNPLFCKRVSLDFSMLALKKDEVERALVKKIALESERLCQAGMDNKILVEFIEKKRAIDFYKMYKSQFEALGLSVELMTGSDHKAERRRIVKRVGNEKNILLIATQVIEAGVDIDMDVGFKDTSILDAEEQFLGRINRSCKKQGARAYFLNLGDAEKIYTQDARILKNFILDADNEHIKSILRNKNFDEYYQGVLDILSKGSESKSSYGMAAFKRDLYSLNFDKIREGMELIKNDNEKVEIFLARTITLEDGTVLNGHEVFEHYKNTLQDNGIPYAQKRVELSQVREQMDYFIYEVSANFMRNNVPNVNEVFGSIYYFEAGEKYLSDGKFDATLMSEDFFV